MSDATGAHQRDPIAEAERKWTEMGWEGADFMTASSTIMRGQQIVLARMTAALRPFGLTTSRFEALLLLYFSDGKELPLARTSERLRVHPSSITSTIDRLVTDALVERRTMPGDRRIVLAHMTPAGEELTERAARAVIAARHGMGDLTHAELQAINNALARLRRDSLEYDAQATQ